MKKIIGTTADRRTTDRRFPRAWLSKRKASLVELRRHLQADIDREAKLLQVMGTSPPLERGDLSEEEREDDEAIETLEAFQRRLADVAEALKKIRLGTYGACSTCLRPIPLKRLELLPSAIRCGACQKNRERSSTAPRRHSNAIVLRFPEGMGGILTR